jgi:phospholipid/cholesterol/gamma-HCH transport system permease protein
MTKFNHQSLLVNFAKVVRFNFSIWGTLVIDFALWIRKLVNGFGSFFILSSETIVWIFRTPVRFRLIFNQMEFIGFRSLFIILLTSSFTGMVFALQSGRAFIRFNAETLTGAVAALSIVRELGPVMVALMVTGRAGSSMAAQLGTMRVTEQIDALETMAINPVNYLIVPRVIAATVMCPVLTGIFDIVGIFGSYLVGVHLLNIDAAIFMDKIRWYVDVPDIVEGLFKAGCFGFALALIGCYKGFKASGGAEGVGKATTEAVVAASVTTLVADYFITALLF